MTVPAAAAWMGVPVGTPMSMPGWKPPQRGPNGLVIGPLTGQIRPAWLGAAAVPAAVPVVVAALPSPLVVVVVEALLAAASAARMRASSRALAAWIAFDSWIADRSWAWASSSASDLCC